MDLVERKRKKMGSIIDQTPTINVEPVENNSEDFNETPRGGGQDKP